MGFDYRTSTGPGKQTLGGHKENLVCTRSQQKGAVSPQKSEQELPVSVQESLAEARVACCRVGALSAVTHAWDLLQEATIRFQSEQ